MIEQTMLIAGQAAQACNGATFERRNPLDGSVATRAPAATPEDAVRAVEASEAKMPGCLSHFHLSEHRLDDRFASGVGGATGLGA